MQELAYDWRSRTLAYEYEWRPRTLAYDWRSRTLAYEYESFLACTNSPWRFTVSVKCVPDVYLNV
jgi:hypothetical protein